MRRLSALFVALAVLLSSLIMASYISRAAQPSAARLYPHTPSAPAQVTIQNHVFVPGVIYVPAGTTVRWTNHDAVSHTVTRASGAESFDSGILPPGASFERRFDVPGTFSYSCTLHPSMTGTVIVLDRALDLYVPLVLK
jgi:plastocyanin